jgi:Domain of unknown function (DUF4203)
VTSESFFALAISSIIAMFFGFIVGFGGYRFFLILLPIWGFFYGFGFGAHSVQALLGEAFLATITSWVVGFVIGALFAALSYLFYFFGVALIAGSLGYALGTSVMMALGMDFGFLPWLVGVIVGVVFAFGAIVLNIQKWVVIAATSLLGAGIIVGTFLFMFGGLPSAQLVQNPVRYVLQNSPLWLFVFLVLAILGVIAQYQTTRRLEVETYDRFAEMTGSTARAPGH